MHTPSKLLKEADSSSLNYTLSEMTTYTDGLLVFKGEAKWEAFSWRGTSASKLLKNEYAKRKKQ